MKITPKMVKELNVELQKRGCAFRYKYVERTEMCELPFIMRVPISMQFLESCIFNCTPEFYTFLEDFFKKRGINKLEYNNMYNTFWAYE